MTNPQLIITVKQGMVYSNTTQVCSYTTEEALQRIIDNHNKCEAINPSIAHRTAVRGA